MQPKPPRQLHEPSSHAMFTVPRLTCSSCAAMRTSWAGFMRPSVPPMLGSSCWSRSTYAVQRCKGTVNRDQPSSGLIGAEECSWQLATCALTARKRDISPRLQPPAAAAGVAPAAKHFYSCRTALHTTAMPAQPTPTWSSSVDASCCSCGASASAAKRSWASGVQPGASAMVFGLLRMFPNESAERSGRQEGSFGRAEAKCTGGSSLQRESAASPCGTTQGPFEHACPQLRTSAPLQLLRVVCCQLPGLRRAAAILDGGATAGCRRRRCCRWRRQWRRCAACRAAIGARSAGYQARCGSAC